MRGRYGFCVFKNVSFRSQTSLAPSTPSNFVDTNCVGIRSRPVLAYRNRRGLEWTLGGTYADTISQFGTFSFDPDTRFGLGPSSTEHLRNRCNASAGNRHSIEHTARPSQRGGGGQERQSSYGPQTRRF